MDAGAMKRKMEKLIRKGTEQKIAFIAGVSREVVVMARETPDRVSLATLTKVIRASGGSVEDVLDVVKAGLAGGENRSRNGNHGRRKKSRRRRNAEEAVVVSRRSDSPAP